MPRPTMRIPTPLRWLPVEVYKINADTQQPVDPNIGRKMQVTYYDIKKNKNGSKSVVAHKSPMPSAHGGSAKDKNNGNGKNDGKKDDKEEKKPNDGAENKVSASNWILD